MPSKRSTACSHTLVPYWYHIWYITFVYCRMKRLANRNCLHIRERVLYRLCIFVHWISRVGKKFLWHLQTRYQFWLSRHLQPSFQPLCKLYMRWYCMRIYTCTFEALLSYIASIYKVRVPKSLVQMHLHTTSANTLSRLKKLLNSHYLQGTHSDTTTQIYVWFNKSVLPPRKMLIASEPLILLHPYKF